MLPLETPAGERIQVVVLGMKGNQVRIGTEVPEEVVVLREGLVET